MNVLSTQQIETYDARLLSYGDELLEEISITSEHPTTSYAALLQLDGTASADGGGRLTIRFTRLVYHTTLSAALAHVWDHVESLAMRRDTRLSIQTAGLAETVFYTPVIHSVSVALSGTIPLATENSYHLTCSPVRPGTLGSNPAINLAPTVAITAPAAGNINPGDITLTATAADPGGGIANVEFFSGSYSLGSVTAEPYSMVWVGVLGGTYTLTAVATDNLGKKTTSEARVITVLAAANSLPSVVMTSPTAGTNFAGPATILMTATASDVDGRVSRVEFYNGIARLAIDITAPYAYTWVGVPDGTYSLKALATDNLGGSTWSAPVSITVTTIPPKRFSQITQTWADITAFWNKI